jgi:hypothetical protein
MLGNTITSLIHRLTYPSITFPNQEKWKADMPWVKHLAASTTAGSLATRTFELFYRNTIGGETYLAAQGVIPLQLFLAIIDQRRYTLWRIACPWMYQLHQSSNDKHVHFVKPPEWPRQSDVSIAICKPSHRVPETPACEDVFEETLLELASRLRHLFQNSSLALWEFEPVDFTPLDEYGWITWLRCDSISVQIQFDPAFLTRHVFVMVLVPVSGHFRQSIVRVGLAGGKGEVTLNMTFWLAVIEVKGHICSLGIPCQSLVVTNQTRGSNDLPSQYQDDLFV